MIFFLLLIVLIFAHSMMRDTYKHRERQWKWNNTHNNNQNNNQNNQP